MLPLKDMKDVFTWNWHKDFKLSNYTASKMPGRRA